MKMWLEDKDGNRKEITIAEYHGMSLEELAGKTLLIQGEKLDDPISVASHDGNERIT